MRIVSQPMRDAAKGEACTLAIPGICNGDPETTVLAHLPDESHGMSLKSVDVSSCFGCHACHDAIDDRMQPVLTNEEREWYMRRAQTRTWKRLVALGVVLIKGVNA